MVCVGLFCRFLIVVMCLFVMLVSGSMYEWMVWFLRCIVYVLYCVML